NEFLRKTHRFRADLYIDLKNYTAAMQDWDKVIEFTAEEKKPNVLAHRASFRIRAGRTPEGIAEINQLIAQATEDPEHWYDFACAYAVASGNDSTRKNEHATRAVELLQKAVNLGFKDAAQLATDKDLASLRDRDDFKMLIAKVESESKR